MPRDHLKNLLRRFIVELAIYGGMLVTYFLLVLRLLGKSLARLFRGNLLLYAVVSLGLIIVQGVVLEMITSLLVEQLRLEQLK